MKGQDLKASFVVAAIWIVGVTMYSLWEGPLGASEEHGFAGALTAPAAIGRPLGLHNDLKHWKLPILWTHQRWGAD